MPRSSPSYVSSSEEDNPASTTAASLAFNSSLGRIAELPRSPSSYVSPYGPVPSRTSPDNSGPTSRTSQSPSSSLDGRLFAIRASSSTPSTANMFTPSRGLSSLEKANLLRVLKVHNINTLIDLRRAERALLVNKTSEVTEVLTSAWAFYVNSHNLLCELRNLSKNYPFSSELLDEAKWMVISDSQSARSWNYCWLVLQKIKNQSLIPKHARQMAAKPEMWGGQVPAASQVDQLTACFQASWTQALDICLRHWDAPPTV